MILLKTSKAQSVLEYAIVISCIAAALLVMQVYIKRGLQGKLRQAGDSFGQQYDPKNTETVSPTIMTYKSNTITTVVNKSEQEFYNDCVANGGNQEDCKKKYDIDDDKSIKDDVFGTETITTIDKNNPEVTTQNSNEKVGPMEKTLYEDTECYK